MGILKLMDFIRSKFPNAVKTTTVQSYRGKILAIDASNWIYQFLIKTQTIKGANVQAPTDWQGNQTGHLIGILSRILLCAQNNITPVWVFDGRPPEEKFDELKRRKKFKQAAEEKSEQAREEGDVFDLLKMSQRTVKITEAEKDYAKKLINLVGLPVVQSPSEAEPQCSKLVKDGLAYGTISEDMDTLAFGCPHLIRGFNKKGECFEVSLDQLLKESELSYDQFVDFCILCGCDYTSRIKNVGPVKAYSFIRKYGSIDRTLEEIVDDQKLRSKYEISEGFNHLSARRIFKTPDVKSVTQEQLKVSNIKEAELTDFLLERQFSEGRIKNWLDQMKNAELTEN